MISDTASFGDWLRRRRKALDLTQEVLARQVGCAVVTIRKIEADERRPSRQIAERLAECLQIPPTDRAAFLQAARAELAVDRLATPPDPPLAPLPPRRPSGRPPHQQVFKGYELREQLGEGGFGAVYRAVQPGIGREVAVKIIRSEYANHPEFIRRFAAEAQIVARLEHPYIVPLYDYWREPGGAYLVMRYIRGGSLHAALGHGSWALNRSTQLLDQVGAALAFAHRHAVVHRDLKPANILLDEEGNTYLADFGIAKNLHAANELGQTQPGVVVASPEYCSPEQIRDESVTPRSDIYSLGILLYELLTGNHPFANLPAAERLAKQLYEPLPPLNLSRPDLPRGLNSVIQRATAKLIDERYADVASLMVDWQRAIAAGSEPTPTWAEEATAQEVMPIAPSPDTASEIASTVTMADLALVENPYKGLSAFTEADVADFFGRAALTQRLLERLAEDTLNARFLAVVGPSGSGKSSVVRAGLIPALRRGGLPGSEHWFVVEALPGAHPLEELEAALLRIAVNPPPSLLEQLAADERGLARAVKRALPADRETELLLVIDQFEELFTLTEDETARAHLLESLRAAVLDPHSRLRVVVTLRADFYDRPLLYAGFGELVQQRTEVVLPLTANELEQAIVGPARRVGVVPAPELVAAIVRDVGAQPGTLPLLQYALTELFERREGHHLTREAYQENGGVQGSLSRRADAIYDELPAPAQAAARQLFLRLITLGEGVEDTRRRVPRIELDALVNDQRPTTIDEAGDGHSFAIPRPSSVIDEVIDAYGRARLLTFDRDPITHAPTVEVAHEALIRNWGRLRSWLDESRADVRLQRQLAVATTEWQRANSDASFLLTGARLEQVEGWAATTPIALTHDERAYLDASILERERRRTEEAQRQRRDLEAARKLAEAEKARAEEQTQSANRLRIRNRLITAVGAVALVLALLAVVFGLQSNQNATTAQANAVQAMNAEQTAQAESLTRATAQANAETEARLATSRELASSAISNLDIDPQRSLLLALQAVSDADTREAEEALHQAVLTSRLQLTLSGHSDDLQGVTFSPDGKRLATASFDSTAKVWDGATGQPLLTLSGHTDFVTDIAFSLDGTRLVTASADGTAKVWDAATGRELLIFSGHTEWINGIAFSPDGTRVATGSDDKTARIWDAATGKELITLSHADFVDGVAFSPDGGRLATVNRNGQLVVWKLATSQMLFENAIPGFQIAFSPDGMRLAVATGGTAGTATLLDAATGQQLLTLSGHTDRILDIAFSPDGRRVATASGDGKAIVWDAASGQQLFTLSGHSGRVTDVAFSPDGTRLATASEDATAKIWDVAPGKELLAFTYNNGYGRLALSPDGTRVATAGPDRAASVWDATTGQELLTMTGQGLMESQGFRVGVAFSPDGSHLATARLDGTAQIWDIATGQLLVTVSGNKDAIMGVAFSPDGKRLATASLDGTAKISDAATGQQLVTLPGHSTFVMDVAFSPDGRRLATASWDKTAKVWDAATGKELFTLSGHTDRVWSVAFSPDGKQLATASRDATAKIWDVATGQELFTLSGHRSEVHSVVFSPDGKRLATASRDATAKIWDAANGQQLLTLYDPDGGLDDIAFSPDGTRLLSAGDVVARVYVLQIDKLVALAKTRVTRTLIEAECLQYLHARQCP